MSILYDGDLIVGALQAALQEVQHPWSMRARLTQPCAVPHQHLRMHACMHAVAEREFIKWRLKITFTKMLLLKTANALSNELHITMQIGGDIWKDAGAQVSC